MLASDINQRRFEDKIRKETSCWVWIASVKRDGYGQFAVNRSPQYAQRVAYTLWVGKIPDDKVINHTCKNKLCVNPEHLKAVTVKQSVNASNRAQSQKKTHCPYGHELNEENKYIKPGTSRRGSYYYCRTCARIADRQRKRKR